MGLGAKAAGVAWRVASNRLWREQDRNSCLIVEDRGIQSCFAKEDPLRHEFVTTHQEYFAALTSWPVATCYGPHHTPLARHINLKNHGSWPKFVKWPRCPCGATRCSYARRSQKRSLTCFRQTCHCFHGKWPRATLLNPSDGRFYNM